MARCCASLSTNARTNDTPLSSSGATTTTRYAAPRAGRGPAARRRGRDTARRRSAVEGSPHWSSSLTDLVPDVARRHRSCGSSCRRFDARMFSHDTSRRGRDARVFRCDSLCRRPDARVSRVRQHAAVGTRRCVPRFDAPAFRVVRMDPALTRLRRGLAASVSMARRHDAGGATHLCFRPDTLRRGPGPVCRVSDTTPAWPARDGVAGSTHPRFVVARVRSPPTHLCRGRGACVSRSRRYCGAGAVHAYFCATHRGFGSAHVRFRPTHLRFAGAQVRFRPTRLGRACDAHLLRPPHDGASHAALAPAPVEG
jgi:hypothetical protein